MILIYDQQSEWTVPQNDRRRTEKQSDTHMGKYIEKHVTTGPIAKVHPVTGLIASWFLKLLWCGHRYVCVCVRPQAMKNYTCELKPE